MFERALGETDQLHAIVDAARPEPAMGDLEATAPTEKMRAAGTRTLPKTTSAWPRGP
jgi:hypothetical protein